MAKTNTSAPGDRLAELGSSTLLAQLNQALDGRWATAEDRVSQIAGYALLAPSKMVRPLLLGAAAQAVGGDFDTVLPAALAVEYLHVATLIHDDVIDDDELRRGRPAVHTRYGIPNALVTGDFLILSMVSTLTECAQRSVPATATLEAIRVLAVAGADVCRGQVRESELIRDPSCPISDYEDMIALKTGALFRGACHAGAILGGAGAEQAEQLVGYAEHLGVAFQIYDDLLPYLAGPETTGKPHDSDVDNLRPTFPVLLGHQSASRAERQRFAEALSGRLPAREAYPLMRELLAATGAIHRSRARAEAEIALAKAKLAGLPGAAGVELLSAIADLSVDRDR
jgi:geranylgeranyl pyrophosphate synthase